MEEQLTKKYGLPTAIAMVIGIVIGSGIFFKAEKILTATGGDLKTGILAWLLGGCIAIASACACAVMATRYEKVGGVVDYAEATDDTTVVFHMTRAFSIWPYTMAIVGIVPEHAYDPAAYGSNPIGSGRYTLVQWDRGQQVILEANPDYYGEAPKMRRVVILFMEEDAAFLAAQAGQVDVAYTSATYSNESVEGYSLAAYQSVDNRGFNLPAVPAGGTNENGVAVGNDFTSDVRVRRALNIGVDRQEMLEALRVSLILLSPFMPESCDKAFAQIGADEASRSWASSWSSSGRLERPWVSLMAAMAATCRAEAE